MIKQIKTFSGYNRKHVEDEANTWIKDNNVNVIDFKFEDKSTAVELFFEISVIYEG
ncbi:MAG: hypothetical protein KAW45_05075 [Thermoplasmatales archaeon]|nr:hypothetical protein [Thermoplasmatales archaeon]